jgi:signal transduction histidine kinase
MSQDSSSGSGREDRVGLRERLHGRLAWWGLGIGAVSGISDTWLAIAMGIDFQVSGRDMTLPVAAYLAASFAALGYAVGHFVDARARARRDAETIREQMRALDETRRLAAQNEKLAAIGRLAAGVAHEVRNPLGVIRASASMVKESFDSGEEPHRACEFIAEECDRLNGLITALLSFARPTEPRLGSVSIEKVIERALQIHDGELRRNQIEVTREVAGPVPEVRADPDLLSQLVLGLLTNATEAVCDGGEAGAPRHLAVRVRDEGDAVVFDVADSGPGVSLEDAEHIFEPFFTTKATGTGLGLAMTTRIVESHAGQIQVIQGSGAGRKGSGACFRVRLPHDSDLAP